jgi:hopanoid biosynthesis associated protein HpnK
LSDKLIINADDFGWTDGHNQAVEQAHSQGALNRASLLCNGLAFNQAVELAQRHPGLGVGAHLTLNEGRPLLSKNQLPNLADDQGLFHDSLFSLVALWFQGRLHTAEVWAEWQAQIERAVRAGIQLTHLDSHKHVHVIPPLWEAILGLAKEYGIGYVRIPLEASFSGAARRGAAGVVLWGLALRARSRLRSAGLQCADHFMGVGLSGKVTENWLVKVLRQSRPGITEVMVHPAVITPSVANLQRKYGWAASYRFEDELRLLCTLQISEQF